MAHLPNRVSHQNRITAQKKARVIKEAG